MFGMEQCSKISDHDEYNSDSSSVMEEKPTDSRRSGSKTHRDEAGAVQKPVRGKRDRKPVEDDVTLTFPQHLMEILENESLSEIVSWLPHGKAFILVNKRKFAKEVLGQYFKRSKFSSFTRKLNRWGFQRVARGPDTGAYFHPLFQRNNLRLCLQMTSNGTKATKEYPNHTQDEVPGSDDDITPKRASEDVRSDTSLGGYVATAPLSSRQAHAEAASLARSQAQVGGRRPSSEGKKGSAGPSRLTSMESGGLSSPSTAGIESSPRPVDDMFLQYKKNRPFTGRDDAGQEQFDNLGSTSMPPSAAAMYPREAAFLNLRQLEARSRAQPPYLAGLGVGNHSLGFMPPMGNGGMPYSSSTLAYLAQLQKLEEARQRLPPQLQLQLAQASLAQSSGFPPGLMPPLLLHAAPPPAPFPLSADQLYGPDAANKTNAFFKAFASEHCFFPSMEPSLRKDSKAKESA